MDDERGAVHIDKRIGPLAQRHPGIEHLRAHGPVSAGCPASLLRTHPDATLTIADYVAEPPDVRLR